MQLLKFARGNAKLDKTVYTFSLPSGFTCPGANECLSKADKTTGAIKDGPENKFRCFSASQENQYPNVRKSRWYNFDLLREVSAPYNDDTQKMLMMLELIHTSLPKNAKKIRIHVAGDFFSQAYFDAWCEVAALNPNRLFYFYTKSINYWANRIATIGNGHKGYNLPNFVPTASVGGKQDSVIEALGLRKATVVFSEKEAKKLKLEIDHDDSHAMKFGKDFALLLHGTQPPKSEASKSLQELKKNGFTGYSKKIPLPTI